MAVTKYTLFWLLLCGILALPLACDETNNPANIEDDNNIIEDIYPYAIGNYWITHYTLTVANIQYMDVTDTATIDTFIVWNGKTWFGRKGGKSFQRNASNGIREVFFNVQHPNGYEELIFKYPCSAGETWTTLSDTLTYRILSTSASVTVPAGSFNNCVKFTTSSPSAGVLENYFKPQVGYILSTSEALESGLPVVFKGELIEYKLN